MGSFDTSEAAALTKEKMEKLKVAGAGSDIKAKLEACDSTGGERIVCCCHHSSLQKLEEKAE
jgi:hypothetical protein